MPSKEQDASRTDLFRRAYSAVITQYWKPKAATRAFAWLSADTARLSWRSIGFFLLLAGRGGSVDHRLRDVLGAGRRSVGG
jgi:hypothetical protein